MTPEEAFWQIHSGLDREGPGDAHTLRSVLAKAERKPNAQVADVGCGPGGDIAGLLEWSGGGTVDAMDAHAPFVQAVRDRFPGGAVRAQAADMRSLTGSYDLIWCAGALYFLGVLDGLALFRRALAPGGYVAFSYPCIFSQTPSAAVAEFWEGEGAIPTRADLLGMVAKAGFGVIDAWPLPDTAWDAYYGPLRARVNALRKTAGPVLSRALDDTEAEIAKWQRAKSETGYLQLLVQPNEH